MTLRADEVLKNESHGPSLRGFNESLLYEVTVVETGTVRTTPVDPEVKGQRL